MTAITLQSVCSDEPLVPEVRKVTPIAGKLATMDHTPDAFAAALPLGDIDRVNHSIDDVEDLELYESDDGYQRQSVIRFTAVLYP